MKRARKPDTTGRLIAHDAAIILAGEEFKGGLSVFHDGRWRWFGPTRLRSMAASLVNQAEDHAEREKLRKGGLPKGHRRIKVHKPVLRRLNHK